MLLFFFCGSGGGFLEAFPGAGALQLRPVSPMVFPGRGSVCALETNKAVMFGCGGSKIVFFPIWDKKRFLAEKEFPQNPRP